MNREIKFRAYCEKHNRWEVYTLGDLICGNATSENEEGGVFTNWCQYTGLQDKDGKDIFENDIIDINQTVNGCNLFKIVWDKYKWNAEYYVKMVTPRLYEYNFEELLDINDFEKDIKIIGTKFDKEED